MASVEFLVIGGTGMLGQALLRELDIQDRPAIGLARTNADLCLDIANDDLLLKTINEVQPAVIVNAAAMVDLDKCEKRPDLSYLYNSRVSSILSSYCTSNHIKYVYISTDHYYTGDAKKKHTENHSVNLSNEYSRTKYVGEQLSLTHSESLVVRTNIVGFRYQENNLTFIEWAIQALKNNETQTFFNDFYTSSVDVVSFSKSLLDLIDKGTKGIVNLSASEVFSKLELITALATQLDLSLENINSGSVLNMPSKTQRNESLGLDVSKAEKILGYSLPTLSDVVSNLANEYLDRR